jgi:hypothetical protein
LNGGDQLPQLGIDVGRVRDQIRYFRAQDFALSLAEAVDADLEGGLVGFQFARQFGVRDTGFAQQRKFDPVEMVQASVPDELIAGCLTVLGEHTAP